MNRHVFSRGGEGLPVAARGSGAEIFDTDGRRYLDGSGGAIVVGVGHGVDSVSDAIAEQARQIVYVHGTMFTTDVLEAYADELAPLLPLESPWIYPVSGGSEAVETALKMARAYHLARGEDHIWSSGATAPTTAAPAAPSTCPAGPGFARPICPGSGRHCTRRHHTSTAVRSPKLIRRGVASGMPKSLMSSSSNTVPAGWRHSSPSRSLGRRWGPASPQRLLAGCRTGVPRPRCVAHRR